MPTVSPKDKKRDSWLPMQVVSKIDLPSVLPKRKPGRMAAISLKMFP